MGTEDSIASSSNSESVSSIYNPLLQPLSVEQDLVRSRISMDNPSLVRSRNMSNGPTEIPMVNLLQKGSEKRRLSNVSISKSPIQQTKSEAKIKCLIYSSLGILLLTNLINYMDRYTIAGVLNDVQAYYGLNNAQAGLLQTSFIVSYMILSPVFGYLGDRYNRKHIMAAGVMFWSIVTFAGSFIDRENYYWFLLLRALVGVGEASYSTIAPTIIADMFSRNMRTKALSIFYFAIPVGSGLGYIVGSKVAALMGSWQWSLRVTPVIGIICSVLLLVVIVEPERGASDGGQHLHTTSFKTDIIYLIKHKSFMLSTLGFTCVAFVAGALALWAPLYIHQSIKLSNPESDMSMVSLIFGTITCLAGFSGVVIGYYASSRLRAYTPRADPYVCGVGLIAGAPFLFVAVVISNRNIWLAWVLIFVGETLLSLNWALVTDILLYIVIPTRRSSAEAIQILLSHALGDAGSPYLIGLMSDTIEHSYKSNDPLVQYASLQYALYVPCFVCVLGGAFFLATAFYIQKDKVKTDKFIKDSMKDSNNTSSNSFAISGASVPPNEIFKVSEAERRHNAATPDEQNLLIGTNQEEEGVLDGRKDAKRISF